MPTLMDVRPAAALPGGEIELIGVGLGPELSAEIGDVTALVTLARSSRAIVLVPEGVLPGEIVVTHGGVRSNGLHVAVAVAMAENLHPVANPAVDAKGNVFTTLSGSRGQATPISIFRIAPAPEGVVHELRPFARNILNPTGLAFGQDGLLYCSSRAEGTVYRIDASGDVAVFAEGLGIATGIAFDQAGDLYVGDRSGTIFKIRMGGEAEDFKAGETFVFATLEPSIAAYHLAFDSKGTLYVTGPTTASNQTVHAIDKDGRGSVFYQGLGRAQGMAFDSADNLYVAASLKGERGIVKITPGGEAEVVVAGSNVIGLAFLPEGKAAVATRDAVFEVQLG